MWIARSDRKGKLRVIEGRKTTIPNKKGKSGYRNRVARLFSLKTANDHKKGSDDGAPLPMSFHTLR